MAHKPQKRPYMHATGCAFRRKLALSPFIHIQHRLSMFDKRQVCSKKVLLKENQMLNEKF